MNEKEKHIITEFLDIKISFEELKHKLLFNSLGDFLQEKLIEIMQIKDAKALALILRLAKRLKAFNNSHTKILCDLLYLDWHQDYESIIKSLQEINDPISISTLYDLVINENFHHLKYDDTYSVERNCIHAIAKIGTEEAINKLHLISHSNNQVLSLKAAEVLKNLV
ncbi:MAG: hypothetical protein C0448_14495 [Sphingobacteriaceae bacterium]|nr:hypothetical protein [Sphingobacteriaceae bacterium]